MKNSLIVLLAFLYSLTTFAQKVENLSFETTKSNKAIGWDNFGSSVYKIGIDSTIAQKGKKSATISYSGDSPDYQALSYSIPANYQGKKIKLTGFIKTENVTDGYAGLWLRIDPRVAFDNMNNRGVTGTTDWKPYEITLNYDASKAKTIVAGGLLVGKGKMWLDNLAVSIDGKPLAKVPTRVLLPAEKDLAFDSGSKIETEQLSAVKTEDLKTLGLIWGFLKYYHPNVIAGNYNWDYELFRILPKFASAKTSAEKDKILTNWVTSLGTFKVGKAVADKRELKMKADLSWIQKSKFSKELVAALTNVQQAKRKGEQFYITQGENKNPDFLHENPYPSMKYPDAGFRLLSLYRYWSSIQYFFPYKYLIEEDWKDVLTEFIPRFINAPDELAYKLAALEIIERIHDTHANIHNAHKVISEFKGTNIPPIEIRFAENKAVVTGFYDETGKNSGLEIGDVISHINDKPVEPIVKSRFKYTPASNIPTKLRDAALHLLRTNDSVVNVSYVRKGVLDYKKLKTIPFSKLNTSQRFNRKDTCFTFINPKIGYLYLGSIQSHYLTKIMKEVENTDGLIIDLRCYPSDFVVFSLGQYLKTEKTPFVKFSTMSLTNPGNFSITETVSNGGGEVSHYKGKIVILVNEITQSQAEYTTMAFRSASNVTVIGSTTAGADGDVSDLVLPGGISTAISGLGVYYPDGRETQRIGIVPDVEVKPTVQGIRERRDEVLEKAIEIINAKP